MRPRCATGIVPLVPNEVAMLSSPCPIKLINRSTEFIPSFKRSIIALTMPLNAFDAPVFISSHLLETFVLISFHLSRNQLPIGENICVSLFHASCPLSWNHCPIPPNTFLISVHRSSNHLPIVVNTAAMQFHASVHLSWNHLPTAPRAILTS